MENTNAGSSRAGYAKLFAIISYLGLFWVLGLCIEPEKNDPYVRNHVNNGIVISLCLMLVNLVNIIPFLGQFVAIVCDIVLLVFAIIGIVKACTNSLWTVPIVGEKFQFIK